MPAHSPSPGTLHLAFLGCGYITSVHARHLTRAPSDFTCSFASRDLVRAEAYRRRFGGVRAYGDYDLALDDPSVDAVVVAVPPRFHRDLALRALRAGKHVLVEKPAFPGRADYEAVQAERDRSGQTVCVGENDHYKPLAETLRTLLVEGVIGDLLLAQFTTVMRRPKPSGDWRNDESLSGGDAFFEEGIHWLHLAGSLGPPITRVSAFRPDPSPSHPDGDTRAKSMLVAFEYSGGAAGTLHYSREVPTLFRGLSWSKLYGREGVITFESNGGLVLSRGSRPIRLHLPGFADIRGYRAMYQDFGRAARTGRPPEMSLERAMADHALMERVYGRRL